MTEIAMRDLRNHTSDVLRRVDSGEEITITVNGRGVAQIVPLPRRPRFLPWQQVLAHRADPGLVDDLRDLLPVETTDDMDDPWERANRR